MNRCNHDSETHHCVHNEHGRLHSKACITLVPIFNHLDDDKLEEIMRAIKTAHFDKGEIIYRAGQQSNSLYIVSKGKIRIYRLSESGKEQLLRILKPGDFTGELALFRQSVHESYAEAMADTDVCMINRDDLQKFLLKYPTIALQVLAEFSNRLDESEKQAARFATERVETRIALYLAECVEDQGGSLSISLPMSRKDMASYLGTTPETISRKLADLEAQGYIRQVSGRKIQIQDLDGLLIL
ncbi:MAG: Crp/Fnr family transcriptional regulator [Caldicoprobacterales bacterium]|jgi:CRP-like cAMP-binding protein|nr:Crp/Fnr family transcriptional regulator [Clostridiales bacterium]